MQSVGKSKFKELLQKQRLSIKDYILIPILLNCNLLILKEFLIFVFLFKIQLQDH